MKQRLAWILLLGMTVGSVACNGARKTSEPPALETAATSGGREEPLYAGRAVKESRSPPVQDQGRVAVDPIVVPECRLAAIDKQDVSSQREGIILFIGSDVYAGRKPLLLDRFGLGSVLLGLEVALGEKTHRFITVTHDYKPKKIRCLKEDDPVEAGQLLAQLDDRMARDDLAIKVGRLAASRADLAAAEKTRDEAKARYQTQVRLQSGRAASSEEVSATKLTWDRHHYETESKREAVKLAEHELSQAQTVVDMHQIRSAIPGVVKNIARKRGEAIRSLEPVFQVHHLSRLCVEGMVDIEQVPHLRKGMRAVVEPAQSESPEQTFLGHLQEVTGVAAGKDPKHPLIVSASEDGSVRLWERHSRSERGVLWHPSPVRAVACTPPGTASNWCVSGAADGTIRLWDLERRAEVPLRVFSETHHGTVTCLAFSPDGKTCASGGEDREICLWDPATGNLRYRFPNEHRAGITSLQFTPHSQLVSASRDNTVRLWSLTNREARLLQTVDRRSGDVAYPGVRPDGKQLLLDEGKSLRLLTLPERLTQGFLVNASETGHFTTFALYSPDACLILTAGDAEGRLQLWRAPTAATRPYVLRQLTARERSPATCASFAPDGSFLVTGTKGRQVLVWSLPSVKEIEEQTIAEVTLVEQAVDSSASQVRIRAEVANPDYRLLPGTAVTLTVYP